MLLGAVVDTAAAVASTRKRTEKRAALSALLTDAGDDEVEALVGMLIGDPRQGALGTGWAGVGAISVEPAPAGSLTVLDVDDALTRLKAITGPGSQAERALLLEQLFRLATGAEQDYLRRLVIGEMRQGALAGVVTDAIADAAEVPLAKMRRGAMLRGDLGAAARIALRDGLAGVHAIGLEPLRAVEPMLASTAESATAAVTELGRCSVEWKLDGIRLQVHRSGQQVIVYTRNLNDVTHRLPGVVDLALSFEAEHFVLDGEIMGRGVHDDPDAFQDTMSSFGRESAETQRHDLEPFFFDALHLDGSDLIDVDLAQRRTLLEALVGDRVVPGVVTEDPEHAEAVFVEAVEAGHEGVMVKAASSLYEAGRRGKNWRKVKPVHTFDLVVLAAEWGHGRRHGWLSNLHLGARGADGEFVMVGKTFKGLTDVMLEFQTERLRTLEVVTEGHTVWVRPELVVEVALDGVQRSTRYPGGVALRFARVKHHRPDKSASDIESLETLRALL